ncbi:MAG: DNA helicase RecQ [Synechococcus sp. Tobar2m-G35]|nr:DNA helicase RecQ [Synechococcus sp. Tobar2m-G35]
MSSRPTLDDARRVLAEVFGYAGFRGPQEAVVAHVLSGGSGLVLMPTGGGKSLCYQVPALCCHGTAVVISPLIALMDDQVEALAQLGVRAAALHSGRADGGEAWRRLQEGSLDLLYISPERLLAGELLDLLSRLPLALFAIDEAHCVSQWGHDFRPEYRQLNVLAERWPLVPRLALTATADRRTRDDIIERLRLPAEAVFSVSFDRPNLRYLVREKQDTRRQLLAFLAEHRGEAGIVYARSRDRVEGLAAELSAAGYPAEAYHAGLDPARRRRVLHRFRRDPDLVVVATIAFGMGIDKPDVRFVAHVDLPRSLEAYYQETGRAGRDGLPAVVWMVHGPGDVPQLKRFIDRSDAPEAQKRIERGKLEALLAFTEARDCRRQRLLAAFDEVLPQPCGNCDLCLEPPGEGTDVTQAARKALSAVHRTGGRFGAVHVIDVLLGAGTAKVRERGHDSLSVFGIGHELDRGQWRSLFRQLQGEGLLRSDPGGGGGLALGDPERVRQLLRGEATLSLCLPAASAERRRSGSAGSGPAGSGPAGSVADRGAPTLEGEARDRFEVLRAWRRQEAQSQGVPPYVVFHDRTLIELAADPPADLEALARVGGVGRAKLERYGAALLAVLGDPPQ